MKSEEDVEEEEEEAIENEITTQLEAHLVKAHYVLFPSRCRDCASPACCKMHQKRLSAFSRLTHEHPITGRRTWYRPIR